MNNRVQLGKRIKEIRTKLNMTRYELSLLSMVNYTTLMNIENGKTAPKIETLYRLATFLGVRVEELFEHDQSNQT